MAKGKAFIAPLRGAIFVYTSMDILQMAARDYGKFINKECVVDFENGKRIRLICKAANFRHLAGLNKLTDLYVISSRQHSAIQLYKMCLDGRLTIDDLYASHFFTRESEERIESVSRLSELLCVGCNVIPSFDRNVCRKKVLSRSSVIFYRDDGYNFYITLGVTRDSSGAFYYPETMFYRYDQAYIQGQKTTHIQHITFSNHK